MSSRRGLTEQAADAAIDQACRMLRLPTVRQHFPETADNATRNQQSYRAFLAELLMAECDDRARRRSERRIRAAAFPREKSLRSFDYAANPNIDPAVINTLAACDWVRKGQPLCLIGDSGTGKSHLLIALGTEAAMAGFRVKYTLAAKLVNELVEAADDMALTKTIARYGRVDLLCIDELGYMALDKRGAELLFQVLTEREEKASVAIASNEAFSKAHMFTRTCAQGDRNDALFTCEDRVVAQRSYVLLWSRPGMEEALVAYEDSVLAWVSEHDGTILQRARSDGAEGRPLEIQLFEGPSQSALDSFMADPRRTALAGDRDRAIARTEIVPVQFI